MPGVSETTEMLSFIPDHGKRRRWQTFLISWSVSNSKDSQKKCQQQFGKDETFFDPYSPRLRTNFL
jgi:hypothetical protein